MNSIRESLGIGYSCLSAMLFWQNPDDAKDREVCGISYATITASFVVATVGGCALYRFMNAKNGSCEDNPEFFWKELAANHRSISSGPVYVLGHLIADDLTSIQKEIFLKSNAMSQLFVEYVQAKGLKPKTVLDLGCGTGANSIPLLKYRINVIAIDNMKCVLDAYSQNIKNKNERKFAILKCADLTILEKYTEEANVADVVIASDVLPYLPILCWKSTMEKIVFSLKPGGYFFGSIFVKKSQANPFVVTVHEKFGAQYYVIENLAERLVKHSGLEMVECRLREDGHGVYDFVARKPLLGDEKVFFDGHQDGNPFRLKDDEVVLCQFLQSIRDRREVFQFDET